MVIHRMICGWLYTPCITLLLYGFCYCIVLIYYKNNRFYPYNKVFGYSLYAAYKNFLDLKGSVVYNFCPVENGLNETFEDAGGAG